MNSPKYSTIFKFQLELQYVTSLDADELIPELK